MVPSKNAGRIIGDKVFFLKAFMRDIDDTIEECWIFVDDTVQVLAVRQDDVRGMAFATSCECYKTCAWVDAPHHAPTPNPTFEKLMAS